MIRLNWFLQKVPLAAELFVREVRNASIQRCNSAGRLADVAMLVAVRHLVLVAVVVGSRRCSIRRPGGLVVAAAAPAADRT